MKNYLLRKAKPVQSQMSIAPAGAKAPGLFISLDMHNDSNAVSFAPGELRKLMAVVG